MTSNMPTPRVRDEKLLQEIGKEVVNILHGIRNGLTFDNFYYVGVTMAFEKILNGENELGQEFENELAQEFLEIATNHRS